MLGSGTGGGSTMVSVVSVAERQDRSCVCVCVSVCVVALCLPYALCFVSSHNSVLIDLSYVGVDAWGSVPAVSEGAAVRETG